MFKDIVLFKDLGIKLTKRHKNILRLVLATTICYMLAPYSAYYISNIEVYMMVVTAIIMATWGRNMMDTKEIRKTRALFIASFFIYFAITLVIHSEKPSIGVLCAIILGYYLLSLKYKYKVWVFDRFVSVVALLFGLSALEYILASFFGISHIDPTPLYRTVYSENYFFQGIITIFPAYYQSGFARFQAFTEEPGLVGTLCAFMLACIDIKQKKWQAAVLIICGILSMSLAFYLMFVLWIIYNTQNLKNTKINLLLLLFISIVCYFAQDAITELIANRISEKGSISALDNRASLAFKKAFDEFLVSADVVFGRGLRTFHSSFNYTSGSGANAGAKPFIYSYGVFSMILLFITYTKGFLKANGKNAKALFILIVFWLSFYQREYWYAPYNMIPLFMYGAYDLYTQHTNKSNLQ